ncbi:RNA/RNP complex-1-interacting phosphatase [Lutzomyia longipalpis]|uniref:Putative mrna capping enzyme guanylyltransferase alpha subunit n=1 Tax=Lutzomyia longipalpis TaxID=7200 RepID=A0A7G3AKD6_LUTLO|nr:RNA/RNP complex-1-interacting phosphatase [Lutzomyia longipalpis]
MSHNSIPDRWLNYTNVGRPIEGSPFIAFKTPLAEKYNGKLEKSQRFTPKDLIKLIPKIGLIVDLTATNRYYTAADLPSNVTHIKLTMQGHVLPDEHTVKRFKQIISDFRRDNKNESLLVGVHCTHGVNRTGYIICRYLIDCANMDADKAIKRFAEARGHDIERKNYTNHLRSLKKNDIQYDKPIKPIKPVEDGEWRVVGRQNRQRENWRSNYSNDDRYRDRRTERSIDAGRTHQTYHQRWNRDQGYDQRRSSNLAKTYNERDNRGHFTWKSSRNDDFRNSTAKPSRNWREPQKTNRSVPQGRNRDDDRERYKSYPQEKSQYNWRRQDSDSRDSRRSNFRKPHTSY